MLIKKTQRGLSLIELLVSLAVLSILMSLAYPSYAALIANLQIRSAAEKMLGSLQLARNLALKSNGTMQFSLVDNSSTCTLLGTGTTAVVSRNDPSGLCSVGTSDVAEPFINQIVSTAEGAPRVTVQATDGSGAARTSVAFNGIGRVLTASDWLSQIDIDLPPAGRNRALRIQVSAGGQIRLCDPAVNASSDARRC